MKASHLHLAYGTKVIYDDCDFQLELHDKVGVVGVNGAGKTTLFKIILDQAKQQGLVIDLEPAQNPEAQSPKLDSGTISLPSLRLGYLPQVITIPEPAQNSKSQNSKSPNPKSPNSKSPNPKSPNSKTTPNDITVWDYVAAGRPIDDLQQQLNQEYEKLAKYPDSQVILDRINRLQDLIDSYDLANFDYELLKIIDKMHLGNLTDRKMSELSGGQKSKVAFARVLFENAGLLLLDEPTNHLDVETKQFVINFLRNYHGTVLVISHDVEFLDQITNKTLFLNKSTHKMKVYRGNYTAFRRQYAEEKAAEDQKISLQEKEIRRISEFVERARAAKRSNTALIKQGHVREKMLEKKLSELGTREQTYARVAMPITPAQLGNKVPLEVQNLSFAYPSAKSSAKTNVTTGAKSSSSPSSATDPEPQNLYQKLSFSLTRGEKFLIVGENGAGKSTLLKLIVGQLAPRDGSVILGNNTTIAYYAQELEILDDRRTVLENVQSYDFTDTELRSMLSNFLFYGDDVYKKVAVLSPGEKARVALCKVLLQRANLLILDEPTNHFDPETQKIIGENLRDYTGTLIMVSHSPAFVEQVGITRMLVVPSRNNSSSNSSSNANSANGSTSATPAQAIIKNYSPELLEYYYYLNSDLI